MAKRIESRPKRRLGRVLRELREIKNMHIEKFWTSAGMTGSYGSQIEADKRILADKKVPQIVEAHGNEWPGGKEALKSELYIAIAEATNPGLVSAISMDERSKVRQEEKAPGDLLPEELRKRIRTDMEGRVEVDELAHKLGWPQEHLEQVLAGERAITKLNLGKMAEILGQDPVDYQKAAGYMPDELAELLSDGDVVAMMRSVGQLDEAQKEALASIIKTMMPKKK